MDFSSFTDQTHSIINEAVGYLPTFLFSLVLIGLSIVVSMLVAAAARKTLNNYISSTMLRNIVAKIISLPFLIFGIYLVLLVSGLSDIATTLVGGTGILGIVIGIAFRNITENFLASILLSIQRPFVIGDIVTVLDQTGMVEAMTTRGTILITLDGNHVQIPNTTIYKEVITNLSTNPNIRQNFVVGIDYDEDLSEVERIIQDVLTKHPAVLDSPPSMVLIEELADSTVNLNVYFWCDGQKHSHVKVKSSVIKRVKAALMIHKISMPDPARERLFPDGTLERSSPDTLESKSETLSRKKIARARAELEQEDNLESETITLKQQAKNGSLGENNRNILN